MLFVYQEPWQKRLLARYGNELSLLDATYKTTRYELPLFFLCLGDDCASLLCDFHREQAWDRWLRDWDNGVADIKDILKPMMRAIARSLDPETLTNTVKKLHDSEWWSTRPKFAKYFTQYWLNEKEVRL